MADIDWSKETKITLTDSNGKQISVENNIVAGTLLVNEIIASGNIVFGLPCANRFEVQLYDIVASNITNYKIEVTQLDKSDVTVLNNLFVGVIESANKNDNDIVWKVVAYDEFYIKRNINIASWWNSFWQNRDEATLKLLRTSLLAYVELSEAANVSLINENKNVRKNIAISSMTFADMFSMICELSAVFPNMNRNGEVEYISLSTTSKSIDGLYEVGNSTIENINSDTITGIQVYDSGNNLKYTYRNSGNTYMYSGNIFMMDMATSELESFCEDIYESIKNISYRNANVKMIVNDLSYKVGDLLRTPKGNFYIFENTMSGSQLVEQNLIANGNMNFGDAPSMTRDYVIINERIAIVRDTVDEFLRYYYDPETGNSAQLQITANGIKSTVSTASGKYPGTVEGIEGYIRPDLNVGKFTIPFGENIIGIVNCGSDKFVALTADGYLYYCEGQDGGWNGGYQIDENLSAAVKFAAITYHAGRLTACGNYYINGTYYNNVFMYSDDYTISSSWTTYGNTAEATRMYGIDYVKHSSAYSSGDGYHAVGYTPSATASARRARGFYLQTSGAWRFNRIFYDNVDDYIIPIKLKNVNNRTFLLCHGRAYVDYDSEYRYPIIFFEYPSALNINYYDYNDVAYGKGIYVVVASGRTSDYANKGVIFTSSDTQNWTTTTTDYPLYGITYNYNVGFIATGKDGKTYMSDDGSTWKESIVAGTESLTNQVAIQNGSTSSGGTDYVTVVYTDGTKLYREKIEFKEGIEGYTVELYGYGNPTGNSYYEKDENAGKKYLDNETGDVYELSKNELTGAYTWTKVDTQTALLDEAFSEIKQTSNSIVLKVDASGKIVEVGLSASPEDGSEFHVKADNINMTADEAINFLSNGELNLTGKNITITSDNFDVDKDGKVTAKSMKIIGGNIDVKTNESDITLLSLQGVSGLENIEINFSGLPQESPDYGGIGIPDDDFGEGNTFYWDVEGQKLYIKVNDNPWSEVPSSFYNSENAEKIYMVTITITSDGGYSVNSSNYIKRDGIDEIKKAYTNVHLKSNQLLFEGIDYVFKGGAIETLGASGGISFRFYLDDDPIPFEDGYIYFDHDVYFSKPVVITSGSGTFNGTFSGSFNGTILSSSATITNATIADAKISDLEFNGKKLVIYSPLVGTLTGTESYVDVLVENLATAMPISANESGGTAVNVIAVKPIITNVDGHTYTYIRMYLDNSSGYAGDINFSIQCWVNT